MEDPGQVSAYVSAYAWGGPTSALQLHHLRELSRMIRPGDTVVDLACGPGPLLLELAALYPETRFVGADLSEAMLDHLRSCARERGLGNVEAVKDDIRSLDSLAGRPVDLVISTSALHHLPDEDGLVRVFGRVGELVPEGGGFYFFDFGLLRSEAARRLFVAEVARTAPAITAKDYHLSLQAAFSIDRVLALALALLPRPFTAFRSALVDFCYFLQSPARAEVPATVAAYIDHRWRELSVEMKAEHVMLRMLRQRTPMIEP